jgi:tetratricopeptide (TPR) repeat protein
MDFSDLILLFKVNTLIEQKDFEGANEIVDELLEENPDNASILFAKALCLDAMGDFQKALEMAEKARDIDSDVVSDEFYNSVKFKANNTVKKTPKVSEESKIPSILKSGENLIGKSEFNKAKLFFDRALSIQSDNIEALVCQAYCFDKLGKKTHAQELIDDVDRFEIDPGFLKYYDELLGLDVEDAQYSHESLREVTDLCDEGFRNIENYKIKDAKACFNKALKLDSKDVNPVVGNAYCLYHLGYYVLSFKECKRAINMDIESIDRTFYRKVKAKAREVK